MASPTSATAHRLALVAGFAVLPLFALVVDRLAERFPASTPAPPPPEPIVRVVLPFSPELASTPKQMLDRVRAGTQAVPRRFALRLPAGLTDTVSVDGRKRQFLAAVLPLVLQANERILADRARAQALLDRQASGIALSAEGRSWLAGLMARYGLSEGDAGFDGLLARVDAVPPSLALAQAALESGWGTSRFAQDGNALFGQRTWRTGQGMVPQARDTGRQFEVKAFETPLQSVEAYMLNLNSHAAYEALRRQRAAARRQGRPSSGLALAAGLERYSEIGLDYVEKLRALIRGNRLEDFDRARLAAAG